MAVSLIKNQVVKIWENEDIKFNERTSGCKWHKDYFIKSTCADPYQFEVNVGTSGGEALNDTDFGFTQITGTTTSASSNLVDSGATFVTDNIEVGMIASADAELRKVTNVVSQTTLEVDPDTIGSGSTYVVSHWIYIGLTGGVSGGQLTIDGLGTGSANTIINSGVLTEGKVYKITVDIDTLNYDLELYCGTFINNPHTVAAGTTGEYVVYLTSGEYEYFYMRMTGPATTLAILNSVSAEEVGDGFMFSIKNCNTDEIVYTDTSGDTFSISDGKALIDIDWTLLGDGYECPSGCYAVGVYDLQSGDFIDNFTNNAYKLIVNDTFTESSDTNLEDHIPETGDGYTKTGGTNSIIDLASDDTIYQPSTAPGDASTYSIDYSNKTTGDFFIQTLIDTPGTVVDGNYFEIAWRVDGNDDYNLGIDDTSLVLSGPDGLIDSVSGASANDYITITHIGYDIKVWVNESLVITATDINDTLLSETSSKLSIGNNTGSGDLVKVSSLKIGEPVTQDSSGYRFSDCFNVQEDDYECTVELSCTNDNNAFGFEFETLSYYEYLRIDGELRNVKYNNDKVNYLDSIGDTTTVFFQSNKVKELFLYELPEYLHDAVRLMIGMDTFYIDGVEHVALSGGDYEPQWVSLGKGNKEYDLASVTIPVVEKIEDNKNKYC